MKAFPDRLSQNNPFHEEVDPPSLLAQASAHAAPSRSRPAAELRPALVTHAASSLQGRSPQIATRGSCDSCPPMASCPLPANSAALGDLPNRAAPRLTGTSPFLYGAVRSERFGVSQGQFMNCQYGYTGIELSR